MDEREHADFDRRVRLALEREPDPKVLAKDVVFQWIGVEPFMARYREGRFDRLRIAEPVGWACLVDKTVREAYLAQALDDVMRDDKITVVRGLHALRVIRLAFLPWTLAGLPVGLAWAVFSQHFDRINEWAKIDVAGVENLTPNEFIVWKYCLLRFSHWTRHDAAIQMSLDANSLVDQWWTLADWSASDWDETAKNEGWLNWFFDTAHSIAVAGIEVVEDIAGLASTVVVRAAQGVGLVPNEVEVRSHIRWIPDPWHPKGIREVVDTENISPLTRLGEDVITGVGEVDDALKSIGVNSKISRVAIMAGASALSIVVLAKSLIGIGKLAKWPFKKLWFWWHAPTAPVISGASAYAAGETLTLAQVAQLPAATQAGIASIIMHGATRASWFTTLAKFWTVAKVPISVATGAASVVGALVFAKFFAEETDQQNSFAIREAQSRGEHDWAIVTMNKHIARLESQRNSTDLPVVGTLMAANEYIDSALEIRKKQRDWMVEDKAKLEGSVLEKAKRKALPKEAQELPEPGKETPQQWDEQREMEVKTELAATFLELRRIRIFLGHKRLKAGEDVKVETTNIPLLRTFITRDRKALVDEFNAEVQKGEAAANAWLQKLRDAGYNENVLRPTDLETVLVTKLGFKKYRKF